MKFNYAVPLPKEARIAKRAFINRFADKTLPWYRTAMGHGDVYGGGPRGGFIWETLRPYTVISRSRALELISGLGTVYITWDNGSLLLLKKEYRDNLPKGSVITAEGAELAAYLADNHAEFEPGNIVLPNELYVFPTDMSLHVTLTGDSLPPIGQLCITSLTDMPETGIPSAYREVFEIARLGKPLKRK